VAEIHEVNAQALHVVAKEIASTLNEVRIALETSAERPGDAEPLAQIAGLLHQTRGVLRVVEVFGGALLAEEMEQTAGFMSRGGDARQQADGLDALMRSVVQLPTYLERVLNGGRDLALVLLPLLNDLRAVRGAPLLSEGTLLSVNLTSTAQAQPRQPAPGEPGLTLPQWARRLRPRFQVALLGLIRGDRPEEKVATLAEVAERIEVHATTTPVYQLWWVVSAVLEALKERGLEDNASVKRLLGQVDRELRRLYELGEERYAESPPLELLNNLLFYVARSSTAGPKVAAVRASFRLDELLPVDEAIEQERESLSAPSVKLMHTVATAIKEDLASVKDALDMFTRKGGQPEELVPQVELLKKIGDTLAVLGLGSLRERVQAELGRLSDVVSRRAPRDSDTLIGIAAALITVEDSLDESLVQLIMPPGAPAADATQDPEFRQVAESVLRECGVNLARIKEIVAQALEPGADLAGIDAVQPLARGVTAGLLMLGKTRATEIMSRLGVQIARALDSGRARPSPKAIDQLADAVVSIEYYMETLQAGRGDPWYMLDNAERCLSAIESTQGRPAQAPPPTGETLVTERPAFPPPQAERLSAGPPAAAPTGRVVAPPAPTAAGGEARVREPSEAAAARAAAAEPPAAEPTAARPAEVRAPVDQLDEELLDVFIEEAREEVAAIRAMFPLWEGNASDRESLVRVRRAFHTLKGSGRMVGANRMGDFAWSIERLVNRVIEGTRERTPQLLSLLRDAVEVLPGMVDALENREIPGTGIDTLIRRAHALSEVDAAVEAPRDRRALAPEHERTLMIATLDEVTMARMLEEVPPVGARVPVLGEQQPAPAPAAPPVREDMAPTEVAIERPPPGLPEETGVEAPGEAPVPAEVESTPSGEFVVETEPGAEKTYPPEFETLEAMDPSLQDIYRREVQAHLDVVRDFLRRAWVSPGPHHVTEDLYRACHTLRGAARTAESRMSIRLADPLHRWLRRLFDHDRAFGEEGLTVLAESVSAFEDVLDNINEDSGFFVSLNDVVARISALDLALEQSIAAEAVAPEEGELRPVEQEPEPGRQEAPQAAEPEAAQESLGMDRVIPGITVAPRTPPGAGFERLLPPAGGESPLESEPPYFAGRQPPTPGGEAHGEAERFLPPPPLPSVIGDVARAAGEEVDLEAEIEAEVDEAAASWSVDRFAAGAAARPPAEQEQPGEPVAPEPLIEVHPAAEGPASAGEPEAVEAELAPEPAGATEWEAPALTEAGGVAPEPTLPPGEPVPAAPVQETRPEPRPEFAPEPEVGAGKVIEYDPDIAAIFCEEATELLEAADGALGTLRAERGSRERIIELQRALHTVKGGARMAGIAAMGDLSHEIESFLIQVGGGSVPLDERSLEVMQASLDELNRMRDLVTAGRPVMPAHDLVARIRRVAAGGTLAPAVEPEAPSVTPEPMVEPGEAASPPTPAALPAETVEPSRPSGEPAVRVPELESASAAPKAVPPGREAVERAEIARVDADLLDAMLNNAGEVSIYRSRLEQQLSSVEFNLAELGRVVQRLKDQLRKLEIETEAQILHRHAERAPERADFDPLELDRYSSIQQYSRALAETASDVGSLQGLLERLTREAQGLLQQQARIVTDLQNGLMQTRMVPFQRHVQRLSRIVRQAAAESGKRAELFVSGAAGELDRQVLEHMLPPFEHLLRNAVVHGIEMPAERAARGKPDTGRIDLALRREGSEVVLTIADDGSGIDVRAVRDKAIGLGLLSPKQEISDEQAMQLILEPGFSTAGKVTQTAGRGVGMDVVATEVKRLGGALFIDSQEGRGTTFTIRLPFTLAISQALVVRAGDEFFALPLPTVEGIVRVPAAEVRRQLSEESASFEYGGQRYRFQHLASFVAGEAAPPTDSDAAVPVIMVRAGEHSTGIVTDELIGSREIVVKSVGPQVSGIRGIAGATILGDGRICIILDIGALVRSDWRARRPADSRPQDRIDRRPFALVVDDSITVRRVTQRLLERNGMRVMTAKDGLDAVGVLQDHTPDVILLDIEMPRMDGYEVASHVRSDPRLKDVPIVMITSRVGEKHRARAIELGVNDYLGKPYQETQLLQALQPLLERRRAS